MLTQCVSASKVGNVRLFSAKRLRGRASFKPCAALGHKTADQTVARPGSLPIVAPVLAAVAPLVFAVGDAVAAGGEYGILEGRTAALVHPAVMLFLCGATGYAGWLGWQWRRTRTIGDEIKGLKAQLPAPSADGTATASPLDSKVADLEQERKTLISGGYRDKHFYWGAILLASGVGIAVEGCLNTYLRTGKLFPGPHLFAGAGIVVLWALAAALTPAMQKGNDTARSLHIALNAINFTLFLWQVPTGLEIVGKVFEFTSWP